MEEEKGIVCVTGATGFLASWLIMRLLEQGRYYVRATVRGHPGGKRDLSFLTNLPGASERLQIFHADLDDPDSFEPAIAGCTGVFHVASSNDLTESRKAMTHRELNGTMCILKLCLKYKSTVKRMIYTSGASAVVFNDKGAEVVDETFWSEQETFKKMNARGMPTLDAKSATEKACFKFAEEHGIDLVSIIPPVIAGPFICPNLPPSNSALLSLILGNGELYGAFGSMSLVHVDDMARAEMFLLEYPEAKGRYICCSHTLTTLEMAEYLSAKYPEYPIPSVDSLAQIESYKIPRLSTKKLLDTGFKYKHEVDDMFGEAIQCCKQKGYL